MVDDKNVLRITPAERRIKEAFARRWKEFSNDLKEYQPPAKEDLEKVIEDTAKCGKCSGGVRAVLTEAQPSNAFATDLEILVTLNCRNAECGWTARQWRTWTRTKPLEI
jgi:bacterioferritin-associated ferredoxin